MEGTRQGNHIDGQVRAFFQAACRVLPHHYAPSCCLPATRIAVEVLNERQAPTRPLMVRVVVHNPALVAKGRMAASPEEARRWRDEDNAAIAVCGNLQMLHLSWPGHVAALAGDRWLIDLSLPQLNMPDKDIHLPPLLAEVAPGFVAGREHMMWMIHGCRVFYRAYPGNHSYAGSREWQDLASHGPALREIREFLSAARHG